MRYSQSRSRGHTAGSGEAGEGDREETVHNTDLFQGLQRFRKHVLTVLQFAYSHQLDSPQRMETRIIQSAEKKEENVSLSALTFTVTASAESY